MVAQHPFNRREHAKVKPFLDGSAPDFFQKSCPTSPIRMVRRAGPWGCTLKKGHDQAISCRRRIRFAFCQRGIGKRGIAACARDRLLGNRHTEMRPRPRYWGALAGRTLRSRSQENPLREQSSFSRRPVRGGRYRPSRDRSESSAPEWPKPVRTWRSRGGSFF